MIVTTNAPKLKFGVNHTRGIIELTLHGRVVAECRDVYELNATCERFRREPQTIPAPTVRDAVRVRICLTACDRSVHRARRIYEENAGRALDETPRPGYRRYVKRNQDASNEVKFGHLTNWIVQYYDAGGHVLAAFMDVEAALALLRAGYDLGDNDLRPEDRP